MMKKLLVLVLILAFTSSASAYSAWFEVDPLDVKPSYEPSEVITINVVSDLYIGSFALDVSATGGTVIGTGIEIPAASGCDAGTPDPAFNVLPNAGLVVNSGGVLLTGAKGAIMTFMFPPLYPGVAIYSFEFHVPEAPLSTEITISNSGTLAFIGYEDFDPGPPQWFGTGNNPTDLTDLVIHVVPEPMTIALLGIGGLFLRRRK